MTMQIADFISRILGGIGISLIITAALCAWFWLIVAYRRIKAGKDVYGND